MKKFNNPVISFAYFLYRIIYPIIDPLRLYTGITGYVWYIRDIFYFKAKDPSSNIPLNDLFPIMDEKLTFHPFDAHYFHQVIWAFRNIKKYKPNTHVDIASKYEFSGYVSTVTKSIFVDLRPFKTNLPNLRTMKGNILDLPFKNQSQESVSCLHVVEHIGLGRYGDTVDPMGSVKACYELSRIVKTNGLLYVSVPIGIERICFNAHRVFDPVSFIENFPELKLIEFCCVDDYGTLHTDCKPKEFKNLYYGCGFYMFKRI